MLNKIYKIINNKSYRFLRFIFFLKYIFLIFFAATIIFLTVPQLIDLKSKEKIFSEYLLKNYGIIIGKSETIKYSAFPVPKIQISNITGNFFLENIQLKTQKLIIYPKILSIYNLDNFEARKIKMENNNLNLEQNHIGFFIQKLINQKNKFFFKNLNILINEKNQSILNLKNIQFLNYGYQKNKAIGEIFDRKFHIKYLHKNNKLKFKLPDAGIYTELYILKKNQASIFYGVLKGKILKSNFKLDYKYDQQILNIENFFFRNKAISLDSKGSIIFKPFLNINLDSEIKNIDTNILKTIDIQRLLNLKQIIKKLNSQNRIFFKSKKFSKSLIENLDIKTAIAYGRLSIFKNFSISKSDFSCKNNINLMDDYPIFYFNCSIYSLDKRDLYKKIGIDYKKKNESFKLDIKGNLNILNNKINFDFIKFNNFTIPNEDLKFFKISFENILFDKNLIKIFELSKIRKFILEIS